jgi:predicted PurR-regulated permease PerM
MNGNRSQGVLAVIAAIFLLYWGAPFFIPFFIALLISYALSPAVDWLTRLLRWRVLSAGIVVMLLVGLIGTAVWAWSDDAQALWDKVPVAAKNVSRSLQRLAQRSGGHMIEVKKAAAELESVAQTGKPGNAQRAATAPQAPTPIPVWQLVWSGWKGVMAVAAQVMVVVFLVFFMLASGDLFKRKLVRLLGDERTRRRFTLQMIDEIDQQIRRYLVVVVVSDVLVGSGTWIAFRLLGMEYPELWGLAAGILHTVPYFGPALIAVASLLAAFVQFDDWARAFLVAGSHVAVAALVGTVFATWLASRQTRMNTTASFAGLLFFGWIWGLWGVLLAIPILAIVKTICDRQEDWKGVGEILGR